MNKKAQQMSVNTIIIIILALIVLVVLIVGFTMGWDNLKDWIAPGNNVDKIAEQCDIACSLDQKYNFCSEIRTLKTETDEIPASCDEFATNAEYTAYGIVACPGLCDVEDTGDEDTGEEGE